MFATLLFFCSAVLAQSAVKQAEGRVLFVVATSAAMERYAKADDDYLSRVVGSGGGGLLKPGDTFSLWRFNTNIVSDFPLKRWTPASASDSATKLFAYMKATKYQKDANFKILIEKLQPVIENSEKLWIIILTDGKNEMTGTPYDKEINTIFKAHYKELRSAKVPFVTVLGVQHGAVKGFSVNSSLAGLRLPYMPPETNTVAATVPTNAPSSKEVSKAEVKTGFTNAPSIKSVPTHSVVQPTNIIKTPGANFGGSGGTNFVVKSPSNAALPAVPEPVKVTIPVKGDPTPEKSQPAELVKAPVPVVPQPVVAKEKVAESVATNSPIQVQVNLTQDMAILKATPTPAAPSTNNDWSGTFVSPPKELMAIQPRLDQGGNESIFFITGGVLAGIGLLAVWLLKRSQRAKPGQESLISATLKKK